MNSIDPKQCPFCHQENHCKASCDQPCWCANNTFPPELLDLVPATLKNKTCICAKCLAAFKNDSKTFVATQR